MAAGQLPEKPPVVTSKANPHYQKRFDTLHGYAVAGDWHSVAEYKVTGSNSYSKMVERYRQDLLAVHKGQQAATTASEQGAAQGRTPAAALAAGGTNRTKRPRGGAPTSTGATAPLAS